MTVLSTATLPTPMPIVTMRANLTDIDIRTLIKGPTEADRAHAAHKICRSIDEAELSPDERAHAESIMAMLRNFAPADRSAMVADDGTVRVTCEFCSRDYQFAPDEIEAEVNPLRPSTNVPSSRI